MEKDAGSLGAALRGTAPTKAGRRVLEAAAVLLLFGYATGRPSLFAGASLLLALYAVGHLGAAYAARSLRLEWDCPARVWAAEPFPVRVVFRNVGRVAVAGVEVLEAPPGGIRPSAVALSVPAGGTVSLEFPSMVRRRGFRRVAGPRIAVLWPFGLARAVRGAGSDRDLLAYPRRVAVPARTLRSAVPEHSFRSRASAVPRGGEVFRGVREWSPGDPPRAIAWRASARHGALLAREFEREDAGRAVVALDADARDVTAADRAACVERACSLAASLVLRLRAAGRRTAFVAHAPEPVVIPSTAGSRALGRVLETLALLEPPSRRTPRRDPLSLLPPAALRGARVILVKAATGPARTTRDPRGFELVTLPSLHASFRPRSPR